MKIAIISDTHDNLANLATFAERCFSGFGVPKERSIDAIIHCGDVTTPETLEWLAEKFGGLVKVVCGNMEIRREEFAEVAGRHKNLEVFAEVGEWEIPTENVSHRMANIKIAFTHKPDKTEELANSKAYSFIFYGHTHKPWISQIGSVLIANPGTLGGVFTAPTYATLDTATGQLALHRL